MKVKIYTVRDLKQGFNMLTVEANEQIAIRNFKTAVNQEGSTLNMYAEDFSLYNVGEFDTETGAITPCDKTLVVEALSLLIPQDMKEK